jgi:hypothetical protein
LPSHGYCRAKGNKMRPCMEMMLRGLFGLIGVRYNHHVLTITLIG